MSESDTPQFSIVVTCKGRLHHLKQTLPNMLEQTNAEVILVDYGCPQGTAQWAKDNYPDNPHLAIVEVKDDPIFCLTRARNIGARNASAKYLCFLDADIILEQDICAWASSNVDEDGFYLSEKPDTNDQLHPQTVGCCIVSKRQFDLIGGYDEAYRGWGGEDKDIYERLEFAGLNKRKFPAGYITPIPHGDDERQLGEGSGGLVNKRAGVIVGGIYRTVKYDITRLKGKEPVLKEREKIMEYIKKAYSQAFENGQRATLLQFSVFCQGDRDRWANFERRLTYRLAL